jgi:thiopurine S-methyltransferase
MEPEFWKQRWHAGEINFHRSEVNALLQTHGKNLAGYHRVYVPLCGKSLDMVHLRDAGHQVFGTEIVETAVEQFFAEQHIRPLVDQVGNYHRYSSPGITLLLGNAFALTPAHLDGHVDAVYDRASLVALDPSTRQAFVASLHNVLRSQGAILLVVFEYDQAKVSGPPWSVSDAEVRHLFAAFNSITELQTLTSKAGSRFAEAGITEFIERAYWIVK